MKILSIQQVPLTTSPDGTEVPLVFENGVYYKIFGNGFESAPFNHDSDNVNFLPVGQGYPTPVLGVITDGKLKLYTAYAPVDYVQLLEFADDSYVYREEVRESTIDMAEINKIACYMNYEMYFFECNFIVNSVSYGTNGSITLTCTFDNKDAITGNENWFFVNYVEAYGRKYYPVALPDSYANFNNTIKSTVEDTYVTITFDRLDRFVKMVSHGDYT